MAFCKQICLFFLFNAVCALSNNTPEWVSSYSVEGEIIIPLADVQESFIARYDLVSGNSVIDFHNGITKIYQISKKGKFGKAYKIAPVNTKNGTNTVKCFTVNGDEIFPFLTQSVLPDLRNYKFVSQYLENNRTVEKWTSMIRKENISNNFEMLLYREENIVYPLRFNVKEYYSLFETHFDDYFVVYKNFSPVKPDPRIFNIEGLKCKIFTGSQADHVYHFNPMIEFINNYGKHVNLAFEEFIHNYNRMYTIGSTEYIERKNKFRQNLRYIYSKNRANLTYTLAVNQFADYYDEEYHKFNVNRGKIENVQHIEKPFPYGNSSFKDLYLPDSFDWRLLGAVTPVRDQGDCISGWCFSTSGNLESVYFLRYSELKKLSDQMLLDCSWPYPYGNYGCDGGDVFGLYLFLHRVGIATEADYGPYLGQNSKCHTYTVSRHRFRISGFVRVPQYSEELLQMAVVMDGPISVSIYIFLPSFKFYSSGVYYDKDCSADQYVLTHSALVVGYGTLNNEPYWIVKNSWSYKWGMEGYILVSRRDNICGIQTEATFIIL